MQHTAGQVPKTLFIEGNIGVGKSTFLGIAARALAVQPVYEPHAKWQRVDGTENLLDLFYKDTPRWAYTFQSYAFISRIREQQDCLRKNPYLPQVVERSVYSDRYCFAKNCFETGNMNQLEWKLYQEWFSWLVDAYTAPPAGFIYLRTEPETCHERLQRRDRMEEASVSLAYLQQLHDKHEQWLLEKKDVAARIKEVPVLVLDCKKDFEHDVSEQQRHLGRIADFFGIGFNQVPPNAQQPSVSL